MDFTKDGFGEWAVEDQFAVEGFFYGEEYTATDVFLLFYFFWEGNVIGSIVEF